MTMAASPARTACPRVAAMYRLQWEPAQDAYVLLFPEGMVQLNATAGEILRRCDGQRSLAQIVTELKVSFDAGEIESDVVAFLEHAGREGWIEWSGALEP